MHAVKPAKNKQLTPFQFPMDEFATLFLGFFWCVKFDFTKALETGNGRKQHTFYYSLSFNFSAKLMMFKCFLNRFGKNK